jgi:glycosyltransferase involved in cell wall biosynthesis
VKAIKTFDIFPHFDQQKFDVFFSTYSPLPHKDITGDVPRVIQVFDLIPILQPQFTSSVQTGEMQSIISSIDPGSDWVICNSESVRDDICDHIGINQERVVVVPLAAAEHFVPEKDADKLATIRGKYGIPAGSFLLSVAAWQPRKNIPYLIQSFFDLLVQNPELDVHLVLVGNPGNEQTNILESLGESPFTERLIFTGYVPEQDISAIYSAASAFVFPSLAEGFGLPPLEAMRCGTPVVCSDTTSLPEVVGDAALLVDPTSTTALTHALYRILTDEDLREKLRQKGSERAQGFSWERYSNGVAECLKRVALKGNS